MKKKVIWKMVLLIGIIPLIAPFLSGFYRMSIESWTMLDWVVMYSFVYWPTYVIGIAMIFLAACKLLSGITDEEKEDSKNDPIG